MAAWLNNDINDGVWSWNAGGGGRSISCPSCGRHRPPDDLEVEKRAAGGLIEDWERELPAGVKFDPNDQQIMEHLEAKVKDYNSNSNSQQQQQLHHPLINQFIPTLNAQHGISYTHPQFLPGMKKDGGIRHFFHRPAKAYTSGTRKRRKVKTEEEEGRDIRWHKTGKTRPVRGGDGRGVIGFKKILVLYSNNGNKKKPEKTNWIMHQYHLGVTEEEKDGQWVASKVFFQLNPRQTNTPIITSNSIKGGEEASSFV